MLLLYADSRQVKARIKCEEDLYPMVSAESEDIVFVKKTFRYRIVFFYSHLYLPSVCRNVFLKSGIVELLLV
jgi:hypothetical protein